MYTYTIDPWTTWRLSPKSVYILHLTLQICLLFLWIRGPISPHSALDSVQFSSVAQSCPTPFNPMNHSTPGLPVHHQLPEFTQTHVHRVSDAITYCSINCWKKFAYKWTQTIRIHITSTYFILFKWYKYFIMIFIYFICKMGIITILLWKLSI